MPIFAFLNAAPAYCADIKLLCQLELITTHFTGVTERQRLTEIIEVNEISMPNGNYTKIIVSQSNNLSPVFSSSGLPADAFRDFSDENKWDIATKTRSGDGSFYETRYAIDRNTGVISYSLYWRNRISVEGRGLCEKAPKERKLF